MQGRPLYSDPSSASHISASASFLGPGEPPAGERLYGAAVTVLLLWALLGGMAPTASDWTAPSPPFEFGLLQAEGKQGWAQPTLLST